MGNIKSASVGELRTASWRIDLHPIDALSGSRKKSDQSLRSERTPQQPSSTLLAREWRGVP